MFFNPPFLLYVWCVCLSDLFNPDAKRGVWRESYFFIVFHFRLSFHLSMIYVSHIFISINLKTNRRLTRTVPSPHTNLLSKPLGALCHNKWLRRSLRRKAKPHQVTNDTHLLIQHVITHDYRSLLFVKMSL